MSFVSIWCPRLREQRTHDSGDEQVSDAAGPSASGSKGSTPGASSSTRARKRIVESVRPSSVLVTGRGKLTLVTRVQCKRVRTINRETRGCCLDEESRISSMEGVLRCARSSL